jgi:hypothetical protein
VLFFPESGVVFSHTHLSAYSCIWMHFQHFHWHAFTSVRRCAFTRVCTMYAHSCMQHSYEDLDDMLWHMGAPLARLMARPQPVQPIPVHVSLALSPLGFSCVSMCGPWCILAHSDAFVCINVHSCAFLRIMKRVRSRPGARPNRAQIGYFSS